MTNTTDAVELLKATKADRDLVANILKEIGGFSLEEREIRTGRGDQKVAVQIAIRCRLTIAEITEAQARRWRCFHCGDVFTSEQSARLHFGRDEDSKPACLIKAGAEQGLLGALREAEYAASDALHAIANECTDAARAYHAQTARHAAALRSAEEAGYERGLADARLESNGGAA